MVNIQVRLTLLFIVIVTVVLGISGSYTQYTLSKELEAGSARLRSGVLTRLQTSLPSALWDLDKSKVDSIVAAEMLPPVLVPLAADRAGVAMAGTAIEAPLVFRDAMAATSGGTPAIVGKVIVNFSREQIEAALRSEIRRKVIEVLLLDVILVAALGLSLRIVFGPLRQLRDGLVDLATRGSDEVEELPENRRDELGDVIRGFNGVQRKLKSIIERTRHAEDAARRSQQETAQAMDDLRRAQESLLQSERLASLGSLVAGVAHEINTPVGIALTSASVLKEATEAISAAVAGGGVKKTDIVRYLETAGESSRLIMNNAYRAAHLIHSFKQIAVDQVSEARRAFELRDYIGEVVASLQPTLKKTRSEVIIDCPSGIEFDSYPGALAQVLTNLVLNCVEHAFDAETAGTIHIGVRCEAESMGDAKAGAKAEYLIMQVRDNGRGIAPELLDRVFDPFVTTRRGQGGTGLGLNIVFNLITRQFGGTITVTSTPGQGATFLLRLPRVTPLADSRGDGHGDRTE